MLSRVLGFLRSFDRAVWVLVAGWFAAALGFAISIPFLSVYFHRYHGLTTTEIGLFFAALAVVRSISQWAGGELSDRKERRWLLVQSQDYRTLSFVGIGLAIALDGGSWSVGLLFAANAVFGSIFMPAANALVADLLPEERRMQGYALVRSANNLGWAIGPAAGGFLASYSYAWLFYLAAGLTLISSLIFRFYLVVPRVATRTGRFSWRDIGAVAQDKLMAWHVGLSLVLYLVVGQLVAPFSVYAVEMVGISESQLGTLYALNGLMVAFIQVPITHWMRRYSFTGQLMLGGLLYFIGYGMMGFIPHFWYFMLALSIVTLGEVIISPAGMTLTAKLAPEGQLGRYMGLRGLAETAGWSLSPLYGGSILDLLREHARAAWLAISSLALVAIGGYWLLGKKLPPGQNRAGSSENNH